MVSCFVKTSPNVCTIFGAHYVCYSMKYDLLVHLSLSSEVEQIFFFLSTGVHEAKISAKQRDFRQHLKDKLDAIHLKQYLYLYLAKSNP